jgi:hypothetical protein
MKLLVRFNGFGFYYSIVVLEFVLFKVEWYSFDLVFSLMPTLLLILNVVSFNYFGLRLFNLVLSL